MPRANRYFLPGHVWHITHRCHKHMKENIINKLRVPAKISIIVACLSFILCGCGAAIHDQFSLSKNIEPEKGSILRGSGWEDEKYGYDLPDVNQIETNDLIIAVQINNFNQSILAIGPIFPVVPTFGLIKEYYNGYLKNNEPGTMVRIAIFEKNPNPYIVDICNVKLVKKNQSFTPNHIRVSYEEIMESFTCDNNNSLLTIPGIQHDIVEIELNYDEVIYPSNNINVVVPTILQSDNQINLGPFGFSEGSNTFITIIL